MPEWSLAALRNLLPQMSGANFGTTSPQEDADMPLTGLDRAVKYALPFSAPPPSPQDQTIAYRTPYGNITEGDIGRATDVAMATSGGGLSTKGIKAYHSSPHDFDRFDLSKIGTGEGAQVYGHGLYFAENPAVSGQGGQYWNQFKPRFDIPERNAASILQINKFDRDAAIEHLQEMIGKQNEGLKGWVDSQRAMSTGQREISAMEKQIELLQSGKPVGPRTYEVNINADPAHFLDWDKPLTQQHPTVQDAAKQAMGPNWDQFKYANAGDAVKQGFLAPGADTTATALHQAGIPGIKYLDQGSRGAGEGSRNYVVFNDKLIDIMRKYGLAGLAPLAGYGAMQQGQEPSPQM